MDIEIIKKEEAQRLYDSLRNFVLNSEGHKCERGSYLEGKSYALKEDIDKFTYERTEVKYKNIDGRTIIVRTNKFHGYLRWSKYGMYDNPTFCATVYVEDEIGLNEYEHWDVLVSNDSYKDCYATSKELPLDLIMPANMAEEQIMELMKVKEKKS